MSNHTSKSNEVLSDSAIGVFGFLRSQAIERHRLEQLPDRLLYRLPTRELAKLLVKEAGEAMLVDPVNMSSDSFPDRTFRVWTVVRARLDDKQPPFFEGDEVFVPDDDFEYRELTAGQAYYVRQVFYQYWGDPNDSDWSLYVSLDKEGESPPRDGWVQYPARLFRRKAALAGAALA